MGNHSALRKWWITFYQYNAEYTDSSTGLQYLRARYYDSSQGRFTAKDTYLGNVEYPLSRNLYTYCYNNPLNYADPSGHIGVLAALAIGVGVGAVVGAVSGGISNAISQHKSSGEFDSKSFWRSVGIGAAAGAVGGLVGGGAGVATGAIIGAAGGSTTGIAAGAAIGAASGISGGMAYRYTGTKLNNSINGSNDSALKAAYNPVGITVDGILGGLGGAISAGVTSGKIKNPFKNTSGTRGEQQSAKAYIESVKKYCGENGAEYHKAQKVESPVDIPESPVNNLYYDKNGKPIWPSNDGFKGTPSTETLPVGTRIDRYGFTDGRFVAPEGTPYTQRSLPAGYNNKPYNVYEVAKPVEVLSGETAPWFFEQGGGTQYMFDTSIEDLLSQGILKQVN